MMAEALTITEADILSEIIVPDQPGMRPEFAQCLLELHFTEKANRRIRRLLEKNNKGTISAAERAVLDKYIRVGQFLDLMQAKARISLQQFSAAK
jgi:hypothetical protein